MKAFRIGLIGAGGRGVSLAKNVSESGLGDVVAAYDPNPSYAKEWMRAAEYEIPLVDRDSLLSDPKLDGVIVGSPDHCHRQDAIDGLRAGKPVLCEKPMAISIADCDEMLRVQKETRQSLRIGFNLRFHPLYQKMQEIAASGKLGRITTVWIRHFVGFGGTYYFQDWHSRRALSTSLLLQKATHDFDVMHFVAGSYTRRLTALGRRSYYGGDRSNALTCPECEEKYTCPETNLDPAVPRNQCAFRQEVDVEDNESVLMELESGAIATYGQCHFSPDYHRSYVFIGTKGRMESFESMRRVEGWQRDNRVEVLYRQGVERETFHFDLTGSGHGGADLRMIRNWLLSIHEGRADTENPIAGRQSVAVGCLAAESLRTDNRWLTLPSVV